MRIDCWGKTSERKGLQLGARAAPLVLVSALSLFISLLLSTVDAQACPPGGQQFVSAEGPQVLHSGFRAASPRPEAGQVEQTEMWFQLATVPDGARYVLFESVWGAGPDSLAEMWGRAIPIRNRHVFVKSSWRGAHRNQAFTLGLRMRFVFADGSISAAGLPSFITHEGKGQSNAGGWGDQIVMLLFFAALLGLWVIYRRNPAPMHKIRVAAAIGLVSVLFLAVSPALSWIKVSDPSGQLGPVDCHLGDESQCATYVPAAVPNPMSTSESSLDSRFELGRWMSASSTLRIGLILCMVLLMPALIWLLVAPGLRAAQSAMALGASAAGYTFLAACCYRLSVPSWMSMETSHAFELALITTANIVVAAGMVVYWSVQESDDERVASLPAAKAHRTRSKP